MKDSLFSTLIHLKGNTRACVYTEPLWGLSMNLCMPYLSVYMLALGLNDSRIGLIVTVSLLSQIVFSFLSGPITDKIGRRKATAIFDIFGWCIPALIWWRAENFWFFLTAAIINGTNGVTANSWTCLLIEDAEKKQITRIFSLTTAFGQLSAVFAPITAILISSLTLIPAIRILFLNGFILMVVKIILLYMASKETGIGKMRLEETKGKNIFQLSGGYGDVVKMILQSRGMIFSIIIAALGWIVGTINNTFWQIIVNKKLLVPEVMLPFFNIFKSVLAIIFLFFVIPKLLKGILKLPLVFAFSSYFIGQSLLIMIPADGIIKYPLILLSLMFDGFGLGALAMLGESLINIHVNPNERARILAIRFMFIMLATAPFGWIGGMLSEMSRNLPFVLNLSILVFGIIITLIHYRKENDHSAEHA
ncbi:MAG: MFS transporter [Treponema sp.]|jgi:MFS family permease|nr:MFS transporter [Treponema sp.]